MCKFLKADLEVDPELLKGTDRMKAQGFTAPVSTGHKNKTCQASFVELIEQLDATSFNTVGTSDF